MRSEDWNKIKDVLDDVLHIEPTDRKAYLDGLQINREVYAEVESLMAFEEESADLMQLSAVEFSTAFMDGPEPNDDLSRQQEVRTIKAKSGRG